MEQKMMIKGAVRLHLEEDGRIVGDSGWLKNIVTTGGFQNFCNLIGTSLTGSQINFVNVGTGGTPASNATALPNEVIGTGGVVVRTGVTAQTQAGSKTLRFTATLLSSASFISSTAGRTINNVGLFCHSTTDNLQAGVSYAASLCATNQNVRNWRQLLETVVSKLRKFGEHLFETIPSQAVSKSTYGLAYGRV